MFLKFATTTLTNSGDDQAKRDDVWEKLKPNIHNSYLYEPLLLFVEQLENPATFITKVWGLKDDIFRNNLIFISYALNQVKTKMQDKAIFKDLLKELLDVWQSESPFAAQTDSHLIKCILLIGGIQELVEAFSRITQSEGRVKIIKAISRLKDKSVISVLTGLIENENDSEVRETIIRNIIKLSDKNNLPLLEKLLKNEYSPQLKSKIVRFLVNDVEDAIPFLIKLYKNETDLEVKDTIIRLIRKHGDKNAIPLLKPLFEKEIYELVRYRLAKLIAALGGKQSAVLYFEELFNRKGNSLDDSYVKMELIYYIGEMGDINALPILKSLLKRSYNIEGLYEDVELKISILNAIGTIGDKDYAFRKIKEIYDDEADFSAKMYQADLIAKFGNKESAIKCLQKSLENETIPNRIVDIIDAILKICDYEINNPYLKGSIMSHLKGQYQKENSYGVRRNFVESIGMVGGKNDIPFLKEIFEKEDSVHVRRAIVKSIENLGDENDIPFLKEIFEKEENFRERRDIVKSIESLGDENTTPILKELFEKEKHSNVRYALAISIGNLGSKDTLTFLKSHFSTEDNSLVKRGLSKSIAKLADKKDSVLYFKEIIESQDNANVKIDYAHAIHEIVKTENLQVFEGEGTQWDFKKITERYTF